MNHNIIDSSQYFAQPYGVPAPDTLI